MTGLTAEEILAMDDRHIWHPYASIDGSVSVYPVRSAQGCVLHLANGQSLLDGMSSWWSAIHGYNHPRLNAAIEQQLQSMAHIMFGGLTHEPAVQLACKLVKIAPTGLNRVFFSDSGSVAVEVAMKMALQYWQVKSQPRRNRFVALSGGYHGDTFAAMSVCDPTTGMHRLFGDAVAKQFFLSRPAKRFHEDCSEEDFASLTELFACHGHEIAALILEPVVQGAGGMWFYSPDYLQRFRSICDEYGILLIADEIATGFGRTGKLFACEHANISPDILCLGKALTGGYLTLAATMCADYIAETICAGEAGALMHGPTFMANPLACSVANASVDLLLSGGWQSNVRRIEKALEKGLAPAWNIQGVVDVRVLGAIGVVELEKPVDMEKIQPMFIKHGIWIRPFGKLVYTMPPFVASDVELDYLTNNIVNVLGEYCHV